MKLSSLLSIPLFCLALPSVLGAPPAPFSTHRKGHHPHKSNDGVMVKNIPEHPGLSISYKETHICETQARAWAGFVHMPSSYLADVMGDDPYNISMFFWYIEARENPQHAPTAIWLAGGPGESALYGTTYDNGPCYVLSDSNSTENNPWSFNVHANILYIDQPVSTGFSYANTPLNSTLNLLAFLVNPYDSGITPVEAYNGTLPPANITFEYGPLPDQNPVYTAANTVIAARTLWYFAQAWFSEFPEYTTSDKSINIWGNSYGGYWVPRTSALFVERNALIAAGKLDGIALPVKIIGITNGCIDAEVQGPYWPEQAYNNTYGLQVISKKVYEEASHNFTKPGGCLDLIKQCRALGDEYDPEEVGLNQTVNQACGLATEYCAEYVLGAYDIYSQVGPRSDFDMAHYKPDPFPPSYTQGYFNQDWVMRDLGVPLNFTGSSLVPNIVILGNGDPMRRTGMKDINYVLAAGVKVALVYGDRDYRCPWNGAEQVSLQADWADAAQFRAAGYEFVQVNSTYQGGVVRQYGNLSFTRVFQAGHDVSAYQPETVWSIFNRVQFDLDVATGKVSTRECEEYSTTGPASSFNMVKEVVPPAPPVLCYILSPNTCSDTQLAALANGTAVVKDYIVVSPQGGNASFSGLPG